MVTPHLGFGSEVDLRHCVHIGILNPVLKHVVDKNYQCAFDTCKARLDPHLMIGRSNEI